MAAMKEICPFAVPMKEGLEPQYPFCRETGLPIKPIFKSPTGFHRCGDCPLGGSTSNYCEIKIDRSEFRRLYNK